jgi:ATP-binding cassette subfamily C (CFTR/MRP) protein 1
MPKTIYVSNFDFSLSWLTSLFRLGANHPLTANELYDLKFKCSGIEFKPTIANLFAANRSLVVIMMVFNILSTAASVAIPTFLSQLITFFAQKDENIFVGIKLSVILLSLQLLSIIWGNVAKHSQNVLFVQVRKILISEVYTKALHLSNSARLDLSHGKILNIINQDIGIVAFSLFYAGTDLIKNVALVAVSFKLLYDQLGLATWGGLGFVLAVIVVQIPGFIAWIGSQKGYLDKGDKRLNEIRAVLYGIKVIKFRALEEYFINRINELRKLQLVNLRNLYVAQVYVIGFFNIAPISAPLVAFILYGSFNKGVLSPEVIFPSLVLFGLLNQGLIAFPQNITNFAYAIISWKRIENLLTAEEGSALNQDKSLPKGQLDFIDACFQWDQRRARDHDEKAAKGENDEMVEMFSLNKIHMTVRSGSKVGIVGAVGSGKSSLFSALIGEMNSTGGKFAWNGKLAYCDQQPWLISDTLRANILLNREFDNDRLQYVISMCDLDKDFKELPMGDLTVVGENGVNLSGGQKARVALARALYNNSDIYLLDDPLSALDAQTGKHVFDNAIMGALDTKTVLLITHQLQVLSQLDYIFVLSQGKIVEQGAYRDLIAKRGLLFDMMQNSFISKKGGTDSKIELSGAVKEHKQKDIMEKEDQEQGSVKPVTYWNYVKVCGGWPFLISLTIITLLRSALIALSGIWLQWWTDGQNHFGYRPSQPSTTIFFQVGYGILGALQLFGTCNKR